MVRAALPREQWGRRRGAEGNPAGEGIRAQECLSRLGQLMSSIILLSSEVTYAMQSTVKLI